MDTHTEVLKETIRQELPGLLRADPSFRNYILELTRQEYAERAETRDRFYEILGELRRDREEQARKWEEQTMKGEEQAGKWEDQTGKWGDHTRKWEEQTRRWEANQKGFDQEHEEIMALAKQHDWAIGALGARWGTQSEAAFRNALAGILERNFGVQVLNVNEYDDQGVVFGRPEQVELDVIIKDGLPLICELKSSMDKAGMYAFERKARFYESRHNRKADRLIVISPMIDAKARKVADRLGIETYSDSEQVESL